MNTQTYGIAKQFYRPSNSPSLQNMRPSSLNTSIYSKSHVSHSPMIRLEHPSSSTISREVPKNGLAVSQAKIQEVHNRLPLHDYYPEAKPGDNVRSLELRVQEIAQRATRNTEEIKVLKQISKNQQMKVSSLTEQLSRTNKHHQTLLQECLNQITAVKDQLAENEAKIKQREHECLEKLIMKFDQKNMVRIKTMIEERVKQETIKVKLIIVNEISKASHELKWEAGGQRSEVPAPFRSKLKYPFKSIKITYSQFLQTSTKSKASSRISTRESIESPRSSKILMTTEQVYYIDREGFLLDEDSFYILDSHEKMIRLSSSMLEQLRLEGLLSQR